VRELNLSSLWGPGRRCPCPRTFDVSLTFAFTSPRTHDDSRQIDWIIHNHKWLCWLVTHHTQNGRVLNLLYLFFLVFLVVFYHVRYSFCHLLNSAKCVYFMFDNLPVLRITILYWFYEENFSAREKAFFLILLDSVLTHGWWIETFWYCEVQNSFMWCDVVQKKQM